MTLPLTLFWWSVIKKKNWIYFLLLIVTLGFKASLFSLGIGVGIAIFILYKDWRKIALMTILISLMWGIITIKLLVPYFSGVNYLYSSKLKDTIAGVFLSLINEDEKRMTLFFSLASFGFWHYFLLHFILPSFKIMLFDLFLMDFGLDGVLELQYIVCCYLSFIINLWSKFYLTIQDNKAIVITFSDFFSFFRFIFEF
jgi:hypothetical protein